MKKGMQGYAFNRHLRYGKMIGIYTISIGIAIFCCHDFENVESCSHFNSLLCGALISLSTYSAASDVENLNNKNNNIQYENKIKTYQTHKTIQNKISLYTGLIGTIICIILYFLIMGSFE